MCVCCECVCVCVCVCVFVVSVCVCVCSKCQTKTNSIIGVLGLLIMKKEVGVRGEGGERELVFAF